MRYLAFCILMLAISEPLLAYAKKVVLVLPQQTRRSMGPSWRPDAARYRKSSHSTEGHYHRYYSPPGHYKSKKPVYVNSPLPHGGDDFDRGHEHVNHVHVPYGKGINHAISFGKGYIPYDQIKSGLSAGRERYPSSQEYKQPEPEYASTSVTPSGSEYSPSGHSYESSQPETYFTDPESALDYNERRNDHNKFYSSRSIERDRGVNGAPDFSGATNKNQLFLVQQKPTELYQNVITRPQGGVLLPAGVPSATIGGNKEGIVLRDTVALDEYQQKLQEMTKSWPQFMSNTGAAMNNNYQNQLVTASYTTGGSPTSDFTGSINWPLNYAQPKQGYDVREDTMEPPHDFRTMPVQTSSYQAYSIPMMAYPTVSQTIHG